MINQHITQDNKSDFVIVKKINIRQHEKTNHLKINNLKKMTHMISKAT
jgi:hypothetical protein